MSELNPAVHIPLEKIELGSRLRDPNPDDVRVIQASMLQRRLMAPISVRPIGEGSYRVIYGAHRLLAARNLQADGVAGWDAIAAFIIECDDYEARMREIEENLNRAELTAYDKATFLAASYQLWIERNGSARGGDRKSKPKIFGFDNSAKKPAFAKEMASRLGISDETIRLSVKRRLRASDELWAKLRATDAARRGDLLDRLLKHPAPESILELAERECGGSIEEALNRRAPKEAAAPTVEKIIKLVKAAFALWPEEHRKIFLREVKAIK